MELFANRLNHKLLRLVSLVPESLESGRLEPSLGGQQSPVFQRKIVVTPGCPDMSFSLSIYKGNTFTLLNVSEIY